MHIYIQGTPTKESVLRLQKDDIAVITANIYKVSVDQFTDRHAICGYEPFVLRGRATVLYSQFRACLRTALKRRGKAYSVVKTIINK
jgi:hypothetical protein